MRAVRLIEPGRVEVAEVPDPSSRDQATVRVRRVGVCGSDLKIVKGRVRVRCPRVLGHEMVGEVEAVPAGSRFQPGTRVLVDPAVACGWCDLCLGGRTNLCRNGGLMGRDLDGVFAERVTAPVGRLLPFPETLSYRQAGLLQVLGTCVHAVSRLAPTMPGQVAVVIGLGVTGQLLSQLLTLRGARVIGVTRSSWKRDLARGLGAEGAVEPQAADSFLDELTAGRGPDLVVEAVGTAPTLAWAIDLVAAGGEVLAYGSIPAGDRSLPYSTAHEKELTIRHPRAALIGDYAEGIRLASAARLALDPIVTHELDIDEAPHAFELVEDASSLKVLMRVD
jgi:2-desacetyl-2-hydroxyethyl bacteriochlorophyllide A dehydrogenase